LQYLLKSIRYSSIVREYSPQSQNSSDVIIYSLRLFAN